jgi:hypothetical protein
VSDLDRVRPEDFTIRSAPGLLDGPAVRAWLALAERRFRLPAAVLRDTG